MANDRNRTIVIVVAILALVGIGAYYLMTVDTPKTSVLIPIIAGIAGLGGYEVKQRAGGGGA